MENVERYQSLSKKTAIQIILCDKLGARWGELCSFSLTSKGSVSWANILSHFHRASLTLAALCRHTWQWQMRQCVEEWGGGGRMGEGGVVGVPERDGCHPQEKLWLIGLGLLPVSAGHPWPRGSLCEYTFSHLDKYLDRPGKAAHPSLPLSLPTFYFSPIQEHSIWGTINCLLTSCPSFPSFWSLSLPLAHFLLPSASRVHIFLVPYTGSQNIVCYIMDLCTWPLYTWFFFHNSLYVWLCAFKKKKSKWRKKHFTFWF